jgi:hypothetical protein
LISPDGGIHRRHQNWPRSGAKRKESWLLYNTPAKELEERKRFGIAAAAREIFKEMLSLPLYMYQEQEHPKFQAWFTSKILKKSMLRSMQTRVLRSTANSP